MYWRRSLTLVQLDENKKEITFILSSDDEHKTRDSESDSDDLVPEDNDDSDGLFESDALEL